MLTFFSPLGCGRVQNGEKSSDAESDSSLNTSCDLSPNRSGNDGAAQTELTVSCYKLIETIHDETKYLTRSIDHMMELSNQHDNKSSCSSEEFFELQEQVVKLRAMLSTKREQIATMRSVLKANKVRQV